MSTHGETRFLTTRELADLLRVKERKIYDMAAANEVPCVRVTGKLLFPKDEIDAWIARDRAGPDPPAPAAVVAGSHDPLLAWAIRQSGCGLATFFDGSLDGLDRLAARGAVMAGTHIRESETDWNLAHVAERFHHLPVVTIGWARRQQGLIVRRDAGIAAVADLAGRRLALRQPGAGSRILYDQLAAEAGLPADACLVVEEARTETDAAAVVAAGRADAALGLACVAGQFGLGFVPLVWEIFDLVVWRRDFFEEPLQRLRAFTQDPSFAGKARELGGYDLAPLGRVRWNGA
ncbi:MAG: helix-turn-helix transcriptional regulator [Geminicoccaceae bacterium]|nr:helix-turn-helix transcriptional regulator [Geminicoccaceae bacterium]